MLSFFEYAKNKDFSKKLIDQYGKYKVYQVNGESVRNFSPAAEEFGGSGNHAFYPKVIPENEIWIEDSISPQEQNILITSELYMIRKTKKGISTNKAYDLMLKKDKDYRESCKLCKKKPSETNKPGNPKVYVNKYGHIKDENIDVWLVDGEKVRDIYKVDAIEGMHGYCYSWVPNNEIWIESTEHKEEIPYLILHEYTERILMKYKKMEYHKAHKIASKIEWEKREKSNFTKENALSLTKEKSL